MTSLSVVGKARRAFEFARRMPLTKLARRVQLNIRRRVFDLAPSATQAALEVAAQPNFRPQLPAPLFKPRVTLAPELASDAITFHFLNRAVRMPRQNADGSLVDWSAPGTGAANQLWRMNLHYMEFLEGLDDATWIAIVDEWLMRNAVLSRGAWRDSWNSYALSLRVVVWLQELKRRRDGLAADLIERLRRATVLQLRFLVSNLETDLGGNHLIKNIKALIWASACFEGHEATRWRELGLKHLERALRHQILADGVHDERSASYHCQVFADLLECRHVLGCDPLRGELDDALVRMSRATVDLTHPDGGVALFNDAGLSMAYTPGDCLSAFESVFERAGPVNSDAAQADTRPRTVFAYPDAGYFGVRTPDLYLIADCGRIAPDDLPAHGHGDILAFELSIASHRMIVDQGVFEYVAGEKRSTSRAAASHNTLSLEGTDQAEFFGAFRCGRRPNVTTRNYSPTDDGFILEGSHDGYAHLPGRPIHVRQ
ncbi:MAG: alginate lyase family protein, partial [Pseudomonadota bacterium]